MKKQKWVLKNKKGDFKSIAMEQGVSEIMARLLVNRDLDTKDKRDEFLHPSFRYLETNGKLTNVDKAAGLLQQAVDSKKSIRIIGDYDVDGITSTYILYDALKAGGAVVSYRIPNRITDGYGINEEMVEDAAREGVEVILTCDNGISEYRTIERAKELGMTVVLTDHHEVPHDGERQILPPADVVVNPHQEGENNTFQKYCGCVVAMKVLEQMGVNIEKYLPYAAMATLCDVMELVGENRVIVILGLGIMRRCEDPGLTALIRACSIEKANVNAYNIGFNIGPCLNASGRLDTAEKGLELLLQKDSEKAKLQAEELVALNNERKEMTRQGVEEACRIIDEAAGEKGPDKVLVVYLPECHESIAGIIAGRIREYYYRPTIIITDSENGLKGSGRSIPGYHMYNELCKVAHLLERFGGHPMAAGLSLEKNRLNELKNRLNDACTLTEEDFLDKVRIDMILPFEYVNIKLMDEIDRISPTGNGNEKVLFAEKKVMPVSARILGQNRNVLKFLMTNDSGTRFDAVYFGDIPRVMEEMKQAFGVSEVDKMMRGYRHNVRFSITYVPGINDYQGVKTIQAKIEDFKFD